MQNNKDIDLLMGIMQLMETVNDSMLKILDLLEKNFGATGAIHIEGEPNTGWSATCGKLLQEAFVDLESSGLAEREIYDLVVDGKRVGTEIYEVGPFEGEQVSTFDQPAYFSIDDDTCDTDDLSDDEIDSLGQKQTEEYPGTEKF